VQASACELFEREVLEHRPLLPELTEEEPLDVMASGSTPQLRELRLHNSTIWMWNRPVYDPAGGGHLRIELRALPSGPTVVDMLANAAFFVGLVHHYAHESWSDFDFSAAHNNFYRAAQSGLDATLSWAGAGDIAVQELLPELLPKAREGLRRAGVAEAEISIFLQPISERVAAGISGARWQREALVSFRRKCEGRRAMIEMVKKYHELSASGAALHTWPRLR
jgi:gamma-glutamyl:cysteine ligase YbdK (ATP-grasp superfamily)